MSNVLAEMYRNRTFDGTFELGLPDETDKAVLQLMVYTGF